MTYNFVSKLYPSIYTMYYPDLIACIFMEKSIGLAFHKYYLNDRLRSAYMFKDKPKGQRMGIRHLLHRRAEMAHARLC